jgi:hypothetical protein
MALAQKPIYPTPAQTDIPGSIGALAGDFNGDGQPDVVYLNALPGSLGVDAKVTVLLSQGANPPISVSSAPFPCPGSGQGISMTTADLNKDNRLDLILACPTGYVAVLLGNGDGSFSNPVFYAVFGAQTLASPVDLNGDGFLDVAVTSATSSGAVSVVVLLNQGSANPGVLLAPKSYIVSTAASFFPAIGTGDFNGDGRQDFIVGNSTSKLSVLYGNGDGTLQPPQTASTGGVFATGDFNHDGITDVACVVTDPQDIQPTTLQVLLGSPAGQFTIGPTLALFPESNYSALIPAGTTHSSNSVDLAVVGDITSILLGDGKGGFILGQSYGITGTALGSQTDTTGNTSLIYATSSDLYTIPGNGDGTFRAPLAYFMGPLGFASGLNPGFITADINGDGLTDLLFVDSSGILKSALSRGDGTFSLAGEAASNNRGFLVAGDFNRDGKTDVAAILLGSGNGHGGVLQDSEVFVYNGNGDGTFQPASAPLDLHVVGALQAVVDDFNGDSLPDIVLSYSNQDSGSQLFGSGLVLLFGKGDGTFAAPVVLPQTLLLGEPELVSLDLNNDGKPDIVWNDTVFYGNGDGTFRQLPLPSPGAPLTLGDLNGDGIPDFAVASVYAGNGDGTFHATPFYTAALPANSMVDSDIIADLNGDGTPDLLLQYHSYSDGLDHLSLSFGDGKGNFVLDNNTYLLGQQSSNLFPAFGSLARLNDRSPLPLGDSTPDFISSFASNTGNISAVAFLNQLNPAPTTLPAAPSPTAPAALFSLTNLIVSAATLDQSQPVTFAAEVTGVNTPTGSVSFTSGTTVLGNATIANGQALVTRSFATPGVYAVVASYAGDSNSLPSNSSPFTLTVVPEKATLAVSSSTANENQPLTFSVTITGVNPSGSVALVSGPTTLGMVTLTNGGAAFSVPFSVPGTDVITANYSGDPNNPAIVSSPVSVTVAAPDFTVSASPSSATIKAGQTATFNITLTPSGGYAGTARLSCGALPSEAACNFSSASVTPANGSPGTTMLTISTTAPVMASGGSPGTALPVLAAVGLVCLALAPAGKSRRFRSILVVLWLAGIFAAIIGCSASPSPAGDRGTPTGTQSVAVTLADSTGTISHTLSLQITIE